MFLMPLFTKAYDIEVNGIYYNLDENNRTAKVTASTFYDKYSGDIIIPDVINHNETEYFVTEIESFAFLSSDLTSIVIGNNVIKVGDLAFSGCINLLSVIFPSNLQVIGMSAFYNCSKLKSIVLSESINTIEEAAFANCEGLTELVIPYGLNTIEKFTFSNCFNLKKVILPSSITSIYDSGFYGMGIIFGGDFYCYSAEVPVTGENAFYVDFTSHLGTLHVPAASVDKYRSANQWKLFGNIVAIKDDEPYPTKIGNSRIESHKKSAIYTIHGKQIDSPQRGINIIRTEDGKTQKIMIK